MAVKAKKLYVDRYVIDEEAYKSLNEVEKIYMGSGFQDGDSVYEIQVLRKLEMSQAGINFKEVK